MVPRPVETGNPFLTAAHRFHAHTLSYAGMTWAAGFKFNKKDYFCSMKNRFPFLIALAVTLSACTPKSDPLFGTWTVSKVNVQFDEQLSTPELVKQVGEMEKQNVIKISNDSILTFKGLDIEWHDRISLKNETLLRNGAVFGSWKNGEIVTRSGSPLGEVVVVYRK